MDDVLAISAGADGAGTVLTLAGPLTMAGIGPASARLADLVATGPLAIDMAGVTALDTAGAWALHRVQQRWQLAGQPCRITGLAPQGERLLAEIARHDVPVPIRPPAPPFLLGRLDRIGGAVADAIGNIGTFLGFLGQVMVVLGLTLLGRRRLRWHALVHQCELVGVNALGIIALLLFLVGLVVAQQGAVQLRQFGAEVFTVNLIGRATTRELGILLTAIMVAGRSGAAFAAQLGSMKLNQEVDALATIGMSPIEVLVVPRVLACALMLMLLAFWGGVMALIGGGAFVWLDFDLAPGAYVRRLAEVTPLSDFVIGMVKAPVFGFIIALMGCFHGLQVTGNAEDVGTRTTRAVVEAIFVVIVADAFFAFFFSLLGFN